jgi:tetratricopeptide (TPR) repeat protein
MQDALVGEDHIKPEEGKSVTDLEIEFGVLASKEQLVRSVFYFRNPLPYASFPKEKAALFSDAYNQNLTETEKEERKTALEKLKAKIVLHFETQKLKDKVKTYTAKWDEATNKVTGLEAWGDMVYTDILEECKSHAKETWEQVPKNWQEQELALLNAFIEQHTHITTTVKDGRSLKVPTFCGREDLLKELKKHLLSDGSGNWGLVLTGESGSGKSAVFSMATKMMQQENCLILAHSAGLSPRAKKVTDLLKIWNKQLADHLGIKEELNDVTKADDDFASRLAGEQGKETTTPIEKLQEKFLELLQKASAKKRVVLLIDALDRFEPTARAQHLSWLPSLMPQNVRLLCTAITGTEKKATQYHKGLIEKSIEVFSPKEASEMLLSLSQKQHKTLPGKVENILLTKKRSDGQLATANPLWLSLAVNLLMAIDQDDFEKMSRLEGRGDQQIETYLANMATAFDSLPGPLFISLTEKAGEIFGKDFCEAVFNYIAISRNGLREKDLEKLLPLNLWDPLLFAGLRRWFKAHLALQGEELQWNLAHSILKNTLREKMQEKQYNSLHFTIASYLLSLAESDTLRITETMHHLLESDKLPEAANYYGGNLTESETNGATTVLAEAIAGSEKGLKKATQLPHLLVTQFALLHGILEKFIFNLNDELTIEGNLMQRLTLLNDLNSTLQNTFELKKADAYFRYDYASLSDKLGSIHQAMGHMDEALKYFENYNQLSKELCETNPQNESLKHDLAISYERLGSIHQAIGHMEEALKYFDNEVRLFKELYDTNPQNESLKYGLAISYQFFGNIHQAIGHMEEALKYFENYNQLFKELYEANPQNESLKKGLAISYSKLGSIHQAIGHMEEALKYFEKRSQLGKELYEANPQNESLKKGLAISYERLGSIHQAIGHIDEALKYFENYNQLSKELCETNPQNESLKHDLAISYERLGSIHQAIGHMEEPLKYFENYNQLSKELCEANPPNESLKQGLAISYEKLGELHQAMGHIEEALKFFDDEVRLFKELYEANPQNESLKKGLAISYEKLGVIHQSMGHTEEALKYFEKRSQLGKELYEANSQNESLKNGLAISYERLGSIHQSMGHMEEALKYFEKR